MEYTGRIVRETQEFMPGVQHMGNSPIDNQPNIVYDIFNPDTIGEKIKGILKAKAPLGEQFLTKRRFVVSLY